MNTFTNSTRRYHLVETIMGLAEAMPESAAKEHEWVLIGDAVLYLDRLIDTLEHIDVWVAKGQPPHDDSTHTLSSEHEDAEMTLAKGYHPILGQSFVPLTKISESLFEFEHAGHKVAGYRLSSAYTFISEIAELAALGFPQKSVKRDCCAQLLDMIPATNVAEAISTLSRYRHPNIGELLENLLYFNSQCTLTRSEFDIENYAIDVLKSISYLPATDAAYITEAASGIVSNLPELMRRHIDPDLKLSEKEYQPGDAWLEELDQNDLAEIRIEPQDVCMDKP